MKGFKLADFMPGYNFYAAFCEGGQVPFWRWRLMYWCNVVFWLLSWVILGYFFFGCAHHSRSDHIEAKKEAHASLHLDQRNLKFCKAEGGWAVK